MSKPRKRVLAIMGGNSPEAEISRLSGKNVVTALKKFYEVRVLDWDGSLSALTKALTPTPHCIFNALHGDGGENGEIQGFFEISGIPYTHSGVLASALAMDKPLAKGRFGEVGLLTPPMALFNKEAWETSTEPFAPPYVIKPRDGGSSIGVSIIRRGDKPPKPPTDDAVFMVEQYIPGRELSVGIMNDRSLGITELLPKEGEFYDYRQKYEVGGAKHVTPAPLAPAVSEEAQNIAMVAYRCLGCRSAARVDLRFDGERLWVLEVNTQPGLSAHSLLPEMAEVAAIGFESLINGIVEEALSRGK